MNWKAIIAYTNNALLWVGIVSLFIFLLTGCGVKARMEFPDGRVFWYERNWFDQSIGEFVLYPDGSVLIVGQKSDLQSVVDLMKCLPALPVK